MQCKQCGGRGRYRALQADRAVDHYCYCAAGDAQRTRDVEINDLAPNALKPLVKARPRPARRRPKKAIPRKAAKTPKRTSRTRA